MQIFQFTSLNLPRSFLRSDVFIKKHEFLCIKFCRPALSQMLVYLILWSFQKIAKCKSVCVYMCVCVCVCVCVCKCEKSKQCYSCHKQTTTLHITLRNLTKFQKFINWKFKKFITYAQNKTLPAWNVVTFPCWLKYCIY